MIPECQALHQKTLRAHTDTSMGCITIAGLTYYHKYHIEAYKTNSDPVTGSDKLHFWYQLSSPAAGSSGNTVGNAPWEPSTEADIVVQDRVFFAGLLKAPAVITLRIGDYPAYRYSVKNTGMFHLRLHSMGGLVSSFYKSCETVLPVPAKGLLQSPKMAIQTSMLG